MQIMQNKYPLCGQQQCQPQPILTKQIEEYIYQENEILGKGSFGTVYLGKNVKTQEKVAIKIIQKQFIQKNPQLEKYLKQEINAMKQLNSPHILKIHQYYETSNNHYLILEYCSQGDLQSYLEKNNNNLPEQETINIIRQISEGFQSLINQKFVHRDIKPENILIQQGPNKNNIYKIADLGLVQQQTFNQIQMKSCVGTPVFMSPQVLKGELYTSKSDIWSLGLMFYYILFGKFPWTVRDRFSLIKQIENIPLRFPIQKQVHQYTKDFITKCLQIEEKNRMSWNELFNHQLITNSDFSNHNCEIDCLSQKIDSKSQKIIKKLQDIVSTYNGPQNELIQKIFKKFDADKNGSLDRQEFLLFLQKMDQTLQINETNKIFDLIDTDMSNTINLNEFFDLFNGYDFSNIGDVVSDILNNIRAIIQHQKISILQIFKKFDPNNYGTLCKVEFKNFILNFAPKMKEKDIQLIFQQFDKKNQGIINFQQFNDVLNFKHDCSQSCSSNQSLNSSTNQIDNLQNKGQIQQQNINLQQQQQQKQIPVQQQQQIQNIIPITNQQKLDSQKDLEKNTILQLYKELQQSKLENQQLKQQNTIQSQEIENLKKELLAKTSIIEYLENKIK